MWKFMFQVIPVLAWCVAVLAGVLPLKFKRRTVLLIAAALALAFAKFAFFALVGGDAFVPDLPPGVIWTYGGVYGAAMFFAAYAVAARAFDFVAAAFALAVENFLIGKPCFTRRTPVYRYGRFVSEAFFEKL